MKYIGNVPLALIGEKDEYRKLFDPLTEAEFQDLRDSIKTSGIINNLLVEHNEKGYILLSGHHRKLVAEELGMKEVPCSLAETQPEKIEALFDNANRRQLTEEKRKKMLQLKTRMANKIYSDNLIPELFNLLEVNKITPAIADYLVSLGREDQQAILESLSTEVKTVPKEVQKQFEDEKAALIEKHKDETSQLIQKYEGVIKGLNTDLERSRSNLTQLTDQKKNAEASLKENNRLVEQLKAQVEDKLAELSAQKETVSMEVRKEYESQITVLTKERETRETAIKGKMTEIAGLNDNITSLKRTIQGLESKSKLWELEVNRLVTQYNETIQQYSNPALIEVQLQVISEFLGALVRFVKGHKWDEDTLKTADSYRKEMDEQMQRLVKEIKGNQKEPLSVDEMRENVEKQLEKGKPQLKSVKKALAAAEA